MYIFLLVDRGLKVNLAQTSLKYKFSGRRTEIKNTILSLLWKLQKFKKMQKTND